MRKEKWIDTPRSTAEQIEIGLREGNTNKQARLDSIAINCNFVIANSDNASLKLFASTILRIAKGNDQ